MPMSCERITVLLAKDVMKPVPPADMKGSLCPRKAVGYDQSWVYTSWTGPFINLLSRCSHRSVSSDVSVPDIGLQDRPEGPVLPCVDISAPQVSPAVCVRRTGVSLQGPALRAVPIVPCLHKSSRGSPCSLESSTTSTTGSYWLRLRISYANTGIWCSRTSASRAFGSTGKRANSPQCRGSPFSVWSWTRSIRQYASRKNMLWNHFRGSWGIWRRQSRHWGCSIWDRFNTGYMAESWGGVAARHPLGSESLRPAAKPSPRGQTFRFFGQKCPWNRSPGRLWFTRMPSPRAGGPRSTGLQCWGFGRVPNCTGTSTG